MEDLLERLRTSLGDRYVIKHELGAGGMATVYLADDVRHGRQVALKLLKPELGAVLGGERFFREIHIAASLSHPHILPLHDSGEADGLLYYVMPYIAGETLRERLERQTQLSLDESIELARQVASALDYAHRQGVVHRDIKPENILLQEGHAVVADFGIARALRVAGGERLTETGLSLGTPHYMSPEQASGTQELDGRTDVYALGCVLYEMLAGDPPFTGPTGPAIIARQLVDPPPSLRTVRATVPEELERAIEKALAKVPADRYDTAGAFVEAAGAAAQIQVVPTRERRALDRHRGRQKLLHRLVPALAGAAVAIAAVAAWLLWPRGPALDPTLIAVAPFDAIGEGLDSWRDDAATLLDARLDGAGSLRTVPPSSVREHWAGEADRATAMQLAGQVGAGLVLFGRVVDAGGDSVRLTATLLDAATGEAPEQPEVVGSRQPMDALVDSLATRVLVAFARGRMPPSTRWTSLGSSNPRAIREFLDGELHFRGFRPDSAQIHYERAIAEDSNFALAYRGLAYASEMARGLGQDIWGLFPPWGRFDELRITAGALNRGLARRESLLVAADSVWAAARTLGRRADVEVDSEADSLYLRLFETLEAARQDFRQDPEVLFMLAHAVLAKGAGYGYPPEIVVEALSGALELDPEFLPGYFPLLYLGLFLRGHDEGLENIDQFAALAGDLPLAEAFRLCADIIRSGGQGTDDVRLRVDSLIAENGMITVKKEVLFKAYDCVLSARMYPPDWLLEGTEWDPELAPGQFGKVHRVVELRDSLFPRAPHFWYPQFYPYVARVGVVPADTAGPRILQYLNGPPTRISFALRWWYEQGDSATLERAVEIIRAHPESLSGWLPTRRRRAVVDETLAHLALLRGDTTEAYELLAKWRRCTDGMWCAPADYTAAQLLAVRAGRGRQAEALAGWGAAGSHDGALTQVQHALLRGRINERTNPDIAAWSYQLVLDYWADGDPEVQPWVEEARAGLERLGVEER